MFKNKKLIFSVLLVALIIAFAIFMQGRYVVPILMYHSVGPQVEKKSRLKVTPETLERQMRFLRERHYNIITLEEVADLLKDNRKIPAKTIAVTFDDGYKDNYIYAYPILKKYNIPATIFIIVNEVGRPEGDRLSWDEIKAMQSSGLIIFGSHAIDAEPLVDIRSEAELSRQIFDSKKMLETKLGVPVLTFCYASGLFNDHIKELVIKAGYKLAVATKGKRGLYKDLFALKRVRVSQNANNLFLFWAETSGYYNAFRGGKKK